MDMSLPRRPQVLRQATLLTLGLWVFTYILFLMPVLAATGHLPRFAIGIVTIDILFGLSLSVPLYWVAARLQEASTGLKVGGMFVTVCLAAFIFAVFDAITGGHLIRIFMAEHHIPADYVNRTVSNFVSFSWLYGWQGTMYLILHTNAVVKERELQLVEARSLAQAAQLTALRLQLNPHFLFNTLNAISSLIVTGRAAEGEKMLGKLGDFLRAALVVDANGTGSLGEELEMLQTYLEIESVRFGDRLTVEFVVGDELLELPVPNLILQPLVENAVKYAVAPTSRPVIIRVAARREGKDLLLSVSDNGRAASAAADAKAAQAPSGTGVGLANTRRRLEVIYGARGRLETLAHDDGFTAIVRIPIADTASLELVA